MRIAIDTDRFIETITPAEEMACFAALAVSTFGGEQVILSRVFGAAGLATNHCGVCS